MDSAMSAFDTFQHDEDAFLELIHRVTDPVDETGQCHVTESAPKTETEYSFSNNSEDRQRADFRTFRTMSRLCDTDKSGSLRQQQQQERTMPSAESKAQIDDLLGVEPAPISASGIRVVSEIDLTKIFCAAGCLCGKDSRGSVGSAAASALSTAWMSSAWMPPASLRQNVTSEATKTDQDSVFQHEGFESSTTDPTASSKRKLKQVSSHDHNLQQHKRSKRHKSLSVQSAPTANTVNLDHANTSDPASSAIDCSLSDQSSLSSPSSLSSSALDPSSVSTTSSIHNRNRNRNHIRQHQQSQWKQRFRELTQFRNVHGHCNVRYTYTEHPKLVQWVKRQRYQFKLKAEGKHSTMTDQRQRMLDDIGFCWDTHHALWEERFQHLTAFRSEHGHCMVPFNYEANPALVVWVKCQRRQYRLLQQGRPSNITSCRIERLNAIGFCWFPRQESKPDNSSKHRHVYDARRQSILL